MDWMDDVTWKDNVLITGYCKFKQIKVSYSDKFVYILHIFVVKRSIVSEKRGLSDQRQQHNWSKENFQINIRFGTLVMHPMLFLKSKSNR